MDTAPRRAALTGYAGTAARLLLGGVLLYAGLAKIGDPAASIRADRGVQGTPTVYVDGEVLAALSLEALVAAIENRA